jgi:histone H3/H4
MKFVPEKPESPYFRKTPLRRLMKTSGAGVVADNAIDTLADQLEKKAREITDVAIKIAEHAGRKTVTAEDIKLALDHLKGTKKRSTTT